MTKTTVSPTCAICHAIADFVWLGNDAAMSLCDTHFTLYTK